jgi:hypothetical protein
MLVPVLADFNTTPDLGGGPGGGAIQTFISYLAGLAIAFCLVSWIVGGGAVAVGAYGHNYRAGDLGKKALMAAALGSFVTGAAASLNHFFVHLGSVFN